MFAAFLETLQAACFCHIKFKIKLNKCAAGVRMTAYSCYNVSDNNNILALCSATLIVTIDR